LWGVKYGKFNLEDILIRRRQKQAEDILLHTIRKVNERGVKKEGLKKEVINELCKTRTAKAEIMKKWGGRRRTYKAKRL
jgi:hypothetical protein